MYIIVEFIDYCAILFSSYYRIPDSIGRDIEKKCQSVFPLHDVLIRKVKVLKKPKFDSKSAQLKLIKILITLSVVGRLMDLHGEGGTTVTTSSGTKVERSYEPPVQETV